MTEEHGKIQAFLARRGIETEVQPNIRKAGIIPYLRDPMQYMVMMPVAEKPELGLPEFQICKGTRMFRSGRTWQDMRGNVPDGVVLESLPETALREGIEELGLVVDAIADVTVLGEYHFTSATTGKDISLWLLAAEMDDPDAFLPKERIAASTHDRRWMSMEEFKKKGVLTTRISLNWLKVS